MAVVVNTCVDIGQPEDMGLLVFGGGDRFGRLGRIDNKGPCVRQLQGGWQVDWDGQGVGGVVVLPEFGGSRGVGGLGAFQNFRAGGRINTRGGGTEGLGRGFGRGQLGLADANRCPGKGDQKRPGADFPVFPRHSRMTLHTVMPEAGIRWKHRRTGGPIRKPSSQGLTGVSVGAGAKGISCPYFQKAGCGAQARKPGILLNRATPDNRCERCDRLPTLIQHPDSKPCFQPPPRAGHCS